MRTDALTRSRRLQQLLAGLLLVCLIGLQGVVAHHSAVHAFEGAETALTHAGGDPAPDEPAAAHALCALCILGAHLADALPAQAPALADTRAAIMLRAPYGLAGADRSAPTPLNRGPPRA